MKRIVLTEEQARLLDPLEAVEIRDPAGRLLVVLPPELTPEEISKIRRAKDSKGPWWTGEQIQRGLKALEEAWQREGPFDLARAQEIMHQGGGSGEP